MAHFLGTADFDSLIGRLGDDRMVGLGGDDMLFGKGGNDRLFGSNGFDNLFGGMGNDRLFGGLQNDNLYGDGGRDVIHGDSGLGTAKGTDLGSDNLNGGGGNDILVQGDGNDSMTGGVGRDTFYFKWQDPMIGLAVGTGRAFTTLTDFDPDADHLVFDVPNLGRDNAIGANFVDGGAGLGAPGGAASSFFKGDVADSSGEAVMILTDTGFATGADAVVAAQNEALGDLVIYFNTTANVASLLFVDALDTAHSIARFANIDTLEELDNANFTASDFLFA